MFRYFEERTPGSQVEARDRTGKWLKATIVGQRGEGESVELKVHFYNWNKRFDEWLSPAAIRPHQGLDDIVQDIKVGQWDKWDGYIEEDVWAVETILKKRKRGGVQQYFVRFEGGHGDDNWVNEEDIGAAAITEYEEQRTRRTCQPYVLTATLPISLEMWATSWSRSGARTLAASAARC